MEFANLESYSLNIVVYNRDQTTKLFDKTYVDVDPSVSKTVAVVRPASAAVLFEKSVRVVVTDYTSYGYHKKRPLRLKLDYKAGTPMIPLVFGTSDRVENKRVEVVLPIMSSDMRVYFDI